MRILIVSATRKSAYKKTELYKSLQYIEADYTLKMHNNNSSGLPEIYNKYMTNASFEEYQCILFVHDDVYIDDIKFDIKIKQQFDRGYSVVGLAGTSDVTIKKPALWHLMSSRDAWSGAVAHPTTPGSEEIFVTSFGAIPKRCLIMDGLFLAINTKKFKNSLVRFDTQFTFHHYDIDFCLECNKNKHKMTTANINVLHQSPGLLNINDSIFEQSQQTFIDKHG